MQIAVLCAAIVGLSAILSVTIYAMGRLRLEQEKTLQKLIDQGLTGDQLLRAAGLSNRSDRDLRRGALLAGVGVSWSAVTFLIGGSAWMFGIVPVTVGLVYVLFGAGRGGAH